MLYAIVKNDKYGLINAEGKLIVEPCYDFVGQFSEDRCKVGKYDDISLDHKCECIAELIKNCILIEMSRL